MDASSPPPPDSTPNEEGDNANKQPDWKSNIAPYVAVKRLGQGGFAEVWHICNNADPDKQYACKRPLHDDDPRMIKCIKKEWDTVQYIPAHPYLVKFVEILHDKYIIMEFLDMKNLYDTVRQSPTPMATVLIRQHVRQIAEVLQHLHRHNIIHRDVKPQNVMVDTNNHTIRLLDFGLAVVRSGQSSCGTPNYMAPECIAPGGVQTASTDSWSLGVLIYFLAFGRTPYQDETVRKTQKRVLNNEYTIPLAASSNHPASLIQLIQSLLVLDPRSRLTMHEVLQHPFITDVLLSEIAPASVILPQRPWCIGMTVASRYGCVCWMSNGDIALRYNDNTKFLMRKGCPDDYLYITRQRISEEPLIGCDAEAPFDPIANPDHRKKQTIAIHFIRRHPTYHFPNTTIALEVGDTGDRWPKQFDVPEEGTILVRMSDGSIYGITNYSYIFVCESSGEGSRILISHLGNHRQWFPVTPNHREYETITQRIKNMAPRVEFA